MISVKSGMFEAADELSGVSGEVTESLTDPVESGVDDANGIVEREDQGTEEGDGVGIKGSTGS
jgi:hypothetical protein